MTLVSSIIRRAYRESNLLALTADPTTAQTDEALEQFQGLLASVYGNEMGEPLQLFPIGRNNVKVPSGYPWGDGYPPREWWVPLQARLVCNLTAAFTVDLHPAPEDGSRLGVVDASGNFATYPLTLVGNGRLIEGVTSLPLSTNGFLGEWLYRADLGQWMRVTPITASSEMPFPHEFDDYFITMLALRLNPRYGQDLSKSSAAALQRSETQLKARYHQTIPTPTEPGLTQMSVQTYPNNRRYWGRQPSIGDAGWAWHGPGNVPW